MKLVRHSLYNLLGLGLPLVVAVFCIPVLIKELGDARFGLLTLIWAVVSYFGLFDLGLGRALTQKLAVELSGDDHSRIGSLVATATALMAVLGVFAALLMSALAPWGVGLIQDVPSQKEAINALYWMAAAMPAIVLTSGFRGILEARQAFAIVNLIRLPMGVFTFLGPLAVVYYGAVRLDLIALVLAVGRVIACVAHGWYAWHMLPPEAGRFTVQRSMVRPLCVSGGWMTVSNIIVPLMGYLDRFLLGVSTSAVAVAYYVAPQELIFKLTIVPSALTFVLFPIFAKTGQKSLSESICFMNLSASLIGLVCVPVIAFFALLSPEILSIWIGEDFSLQGSEIMAIMACGMLINCYAFLPATWLQSSGNARRLAYIHLAELFISTFVLWIAVVKFGALGAAIAWGLRISFDALLLWALVAKIEDGFSGLSRKYFYESVLFASVIYGMTLAEFGLVVRIVLIFLISLVCGLLLYRMLNKRSLLGSTI